MVTGVVSWAEHTIWWHVYPLGFTGAEKTALVPGEPVRHRLRQLEGWLDYAIELGCSGLLLGPIFAAETHGYDTVDHFEVDPRLGDQEDFDHLVAEAGRRGMRIVLDGVFNHVGRSFPAFRAALAAGPGSPVLLTVGGIPSIYYGDEQAFRGVKEQRAGGDEGIRPAFPASPAELAPDGWPVYRLHQRLIGFRRRHPWLVRARTSVQHLTNEAIAFRAAAADDDDAAAAGILVLLNAGDTSFRFPVDVAGFAVAETPDPRARPADPALVPGHSWVILSS